MELAVWGDGFCGRAIAEAAVAQGWSTRIMTRRPTRPGVEPFDVDAPGALDTLGSRGPDAVAITFPPERVPLATWAAAARWARHVVLLGTTGSYARGDGPITAATPARSDHPRATAEADVVARGGLVLRLAGLYGGARDPLRWLASGRVGAEPRQVNLIHRDDVAAAVIAAVGRDLRGAWPLADGQRHTLADLAALGAELGALPPLPLAPASKPDVEVDPRATLDALGGLSPRPWRDALAALPRTLPLERGR